MRQCHRAAEPPDLMHAERGRGCELQPDSAAESIFPGGAAISGCAAWKDQDCGALMRMSASRSRSARTKTLQFRLDAMDVLNHPEPAAPIVDINNANFGLITGTAAKSALHRQFQAQLRFSF